MTDLAENKLNELAHWTFDCMLQILAPLVFLRACLQVLDPWLNCSVWEFHQIVGRMPQQTIPEVIFI